MSDVLIFGGTTEGRELAEYCISNNINADVSVTTDYGASLLPKETISICGKLDSEQMAILISNNKYRIIIDATHPYAVEASQNIKRACYITNNRYIRILRKKAALTGETVSDINELIKILNSSDDIILSTLGSKSLSELTKVIDYKNRLWLRILPSPSLFQECSELGYDPNKVIQEKGPFSLKQNIDHIKKSNAKILITKESGKTGGYLEKTEAARITGIKIITLLRPEESGYSYEEVLDILKKELNQWKYISLV